MVDGFLNLLVSGSDNGPIKPGEDEHHPPVTSLRDEDSIVPRAETMIQRDMSPPRMHDPPLRELVIEFSDHIRAAACSVDHGLALDLNLLSRVLVDDLGSNYPSFFVFDQFCDFCVVQTVDSLKTYFLNLVFFRSFWVSPGT